MTLQWSKLAHLFLREMQIKATRRNHSLSRFLADDWPKSLSLKIYRPGTVVGKLTL